MGYFLTMNDVNTGRKVLLGGRIVTPVGMYGDQVKIAEDGKWHPHLSLRPLTEDQFHEATIDHMASLVAGKTIVTAKAKGRGFEFILDDNTRIGLAYSTENGLDLFVYDPEGNKVL